MTSYDFLVISFKEVLLEEVLMEVFDWRRFLTEKVLVTRSFNEVVLFMKEFLWKKSR